MDFEFNDTQQMLVDSAARLLNDQSGVEYWRGRRSLPGGCDPAMWTQFAELGWLALAVPEDAGGLGGSMEDVALLMVELGRGLVTDPIASTGILAVTIIDRLTTGGQREELLGAIAAGERRIALAHDEAGDRYELARPRTTQAQRVAAGYVLHGEKMLVLDGPSADQLLVTATIAGEDSYGIFLVPVDAPGLTVDGYPLIDGTHAADIVLADVAVAADALLAAGEVAVAVLQAAIDRVAVALMAQAVGAMEAAVAITGDYAKQRRQFGQPIGKFQAIQHLAADIFVASYQARSALYQLLAHIDGTPAERERAVAIAKIMIAEAGQTVSKNGIQIHGGYGVTDEYAISHYYRRLFSLERQFGDATHHLARLAAMGPADG